MTTAIHRIRRTTRTIRKQQQAETTQIVSLMTNCPDQESSLAILAERLALLEGVREVVAWKRTGEGVEIISSAPEQVDLPLSGSTSPMSNMLFR